MSLLEIVRVRFLWPGKMYEFRNAHNLTLKRGESVVVQTDDGDELIGTVMIAPRIRLARREDQNLPSVLRIANDREIGMNKITGDFRSDVKSFFDTRVRSRELNGVKLVDIEKGNGGQKLIIYFASEQKRFNHRELAVEVAQRFKMRVELRPVGIRDAARLSGGIGKCGLSLCCSTWLPDFQQISIRMAKDQGLSLDPDSINGQCGRLLCCLGYEHQNYLELGQGLPKVGKAVLTPKGDARVVKLDILQARVTVRFEDGAYETFLSSEVRRKFGPGGQVAEGGDGDEDGEGLESNEERQARPNERNDRDQRPRGDSNRGRDSRNSRPNQRRDGHGQTADRQENRDTRTGPTDAGSQSSGRDEQKQDDRSQSQSSNENPSGSGVNAGSDSDNRSGNRQRNRRRPRNQGSRET